MKTKQELAAAANEILVALEALHIELTTTFDRHAILEAKFRSMHAKKVAALCAGAAETASDDAKKVKAKSTTQIKQEVEGILAAEAEYLDYIKLPIVIEKMRRQIYILDLKLKALDKISEFSYLRHKSL